MIMTASYGTLEAWTIDVSRSSLGSQQRVTTLVHATSVLSSLALTLSGLDTRFEVLSGRATFSRGLRDHASQAL